MKLILNTATWNGKPYSITDKGIGAIKNAFIFVNDYAKIEIAKGEVIGLVKTNGSDDRFP